MDQMEAYQCILYKMYEGVSWGYSSRYTLVHLIQDALICLHLIHLGVPL